MARLIKIAACRRFIVVLLFYNEIILLIAAMYYSAEGVIEIVVRGQIWWWPYYLLRWSCLRILKYLLLLYICVVSLMMTYYLSYIFVVKCRRSYVWSAHESRWRIFRASSYYATITYASPYSSHERRARHIFHAIARFIFMPCCDDVKFTWHGASMYRCARIARNISKYCPQHRGNSMAIASAFMSSSKSNITALITAANFIAQSFHAGRPGMLMPFKCPIMQHVIRQVTICFNVIYHSEVGFRILGISESRRCSIDWRIVARAPILPTCGE